MDTELTVGQRKVTYAFILLSVFKNSYMAVRFTKKHSWDALSFNRTRKITSVEIKSRKNYCSSCNSLCRIKSLPLASLTDLRVLCRQRTPIYIEKRR